ncbi:hypothetical protein TMatcc_002356 [Talaromyces marneffei ATCC 18224]|uniref:Transferase family protein n=1 Tax=Talaromyces marneffei (strain ATCC 18224 / CBS 334.59 / QM 7333) TaxID=441960 RepID=B6QJK9_TALMQ|nr:conserved hypothetical protein [Talaromyces marneffei ATCC 18224]KAE8552321.1 hypothetical protein EYB25_006215 [Talaromyces marneffei]
MVPPVYSTYGLVFQLNQTYDQNHIIQSFKNGLRMTLGQCRHLIGTIEKNEFGDFSGVRKKSTAVKLEVQWLDEEDSVSYSELADHHFSSFAFGDIAALCVEGMLYGILHPLNTSPVVSAFKFNFIHGGLILTMHLHHCVIDNAGFGGFVYQLAENCYSIIHKTQPPIWDIKCLDRSQFRCKGMLSLKQMNIAPQLVQHTLQPVHRPNTAVLLHLPKSKVETLKYLATPPGGDIRISTYDAFSALLWRTVLRHRARIYSVDPQAPAFFYEIVNVRSRLGLPARFQGSALLAPTTADLHHIPSIADVISDALLWRLAVFVRQVTATATPETLQALLDKASPVADKTNLRLFETPLTTMSLGITDVREPPIYDADFGFGQPKAFRHFFYPFCPETLICVYPPRVLYEGDHDAGCEFHVPMEKELVDAFLDDPDVQYYFDFVGLKLSPRMVYTEVSPGSGTCSSTCEQ